MSLDIYLQNNDYHNFIKSFTTDAANRILYDKITNWTRTYLDYAVANKYKNIAKFLIAKGANLGKKRI